MPNTKNTTWNLTTLLPGDNDPQIEQKRNQITAETTKFVNKWKKNTDYLSDANTLREALDEFEVLMRKHGYGGDEAYYFFLRLAQDQSNPTIRAKNQLMEDFLNQWQNEIRFFTLNISKIPAEIQKKFLDDSKLQEYHHFLKRLFVEGQYTLSEQEEKILAMKNNVAHTNWVNMVESFLVKEEREVLNSEGKPSTETFSSIMTLVNHSDKKVRDKAAEAINDILAKFLEVAEVEINSVVQDKKINDTLRGMSRPDLSRCISDDMEPEVIDMIVKTVSDRFDISQRFYTLKAKLLGLPKLEYHERSVPYGSIEKKYTWEEGVALVRKVFGNLDTEFLQIFDQFLEEGRFDVFPYKGKNGGAFCAHYLLSQPTYILLNYTDILRDVSTLAHELGHGINNELVRKKQNSLHFGTPTSTAEVASTFMEDFVLEELEKDADAKLKLALAVTKLNEEVSTIFRQIACYKFEQELHATVRAQGYCSKEEIGKIFQKHMSAYMGPSVEQSQGSENWWVYWSHIRNYFYVYSYAGGLLISKNLQEQVRKDKKNIEKVKEFLSAGLSKSPRDIFAEMNIYIDQEDFWKTSLEAIDKKLKETEDLALELKVI